MSTSRRSFIKQSVSAASAGLFLPKLGGAMHDAKCMPTSLRADPDIRVLFSGLLLYRFRGTTPADTQCRIEPVKLDPTDTTPHYFSLLVKVKEGNDAPYTLWRCFKPEDLTLGVGNPTSGAQKFTPTVAQRFDRKYLKHDCMDWRWTLRIEEFLDQQEPVPEYNDKTKLEKGMVVTTGLFHTAIKTDRDRTRVYCDYGGGYTRELYSIASLIGANIYLVGDDKATLYGPHGAIISMEKRRNVTYEIYVEYEPQTPSLGTKTESCARTAKSHFHNYYYAMSANQPKRRCDIYSATSEAATPDVPCMGLEA